MMLKKTKKSKESVQGFTLVELIIIVAILGVLVAILATAYTKYIEKSRESTDLANAKSAYNELMMNVAEKEEDPEPISFKLKQNIPAGRVHFQLQSGVLPLMAQIQITGLEHRAETEPV